MLAKPVCCFKGTDSKPALVHPEAMENFLETAASGGLDLQLEESTFNLCRTVSAAFVQKCGKLGWRQILVKIV